MTANLSHLDEAFADGMAGKFDEATRKALLASSAISNGYYTVTFTDGGHRTFRVHTQAADSRFASGKRIVGLLIGPDNTKDYEGVAFLTPDGIKPWKRFQGTRTAVHLDLLWDLMNGERVDGCSLEVSKRCLCCNRTLTTSESIERGVGPVCWEKLNKQGE